MPVNIMIKDPLRSSVEAISGGYNTVLYDYLGEPNIMVVIPKFRLKDIDTKLIINDYISPDLTQLVIMKCRKPHGLKGGDVLPEFNRVSTSIPVSENGLIFSILLPRAGMTTVDIIDDYTISYESPNSDTTASIFAHSSIDNGVGYFGGSFYDDSVIHPAFIVNGVEKSELFIGKYPSVSTYKDINDVRYHVPMSFPHKEKLNSLWRLNTDLNMTNIETYLDLRMRLKGSGWHAMNSLEYSALVLFFHKLTGRYDFDYYNDSMNQLLLSENYGTSSDKMGRGNLGDTLSGDMFGIHSLFTSGGSRIFLDKIEFSSSGTGFTFKYTEENDYFKSSSVYEDSEIGIHQDTAKFVTSGDSDIMSYEGDPLTDKFINIFQPSEYNDSYSSASNALKDQFRLRLLDGYMFGLFNKKAGCITFDDAGDIDWDDTHHYLTVGEALPLNENKDGEANTFDILDRQGARYRIGNFRMSRTSVFSNTITIRPSFLM